MKRFLIIVFAVSLLSSCHIGRMIIYNVADVNDYKKFPQIPLNKSAQPFYFAEKLLSAIDTDAFPKTFITEDEKITDWNSLFSNTKTTSFLIVRNDTIIYEKYFMGTDENSIFTSFSANKSFISALVGIAISEGKISSVKDPITKYLTDFKNPGFEKITIENLLNMESGIRFRENYFNPLSEIGRYYYGNNLRKYVTTLKIAKDPGTEYDYKSVNTLLLGMILEKATGVPLDQYYQNKLWSPLGMEFDATLNIDSKKDNMVKSYCCLNARTRDFARFGRLYLNKGNWNGTQVVPEEWVLATINPTVKERSSVYYKYQWRIDNASNFWAQGFCGQFIFVNPRTHVIIVRTGKKYGSVNWPTLMAHISKKI
jgi:CubicO group peptidase (beta-lactamase class C family)